jgi:FkbH-like protein
MTSMVRDLVTVREDSAVAAPALKLVVGATFTAEPLKEGLDFWLKRLSLPAAIRFAPYNQIFQELLDPGSLTAGNQGGVTMLLLRFEDWIQVEGEKSAENLNALERNVAEFLAALQSAVERVPASYVIGLCPPSDSAAAQPDLCAALGRAQQRITTEAASLQSVYVLDCAQAAARYGVVKIADAYGDTLGRIPYTPEFFAAAAAALARALFVLQHPPYKVIVLDCDQTLWKGLCGEDGVLGIEVAAPQRALQAFMLAQQAGGRLLCLCSKNNESDVLEVFERRPEMLLQREHLVAWRINWHPKSENLRSLAQELGVGLESLIFLDDNPAECAEVRANCPGVLVLQLPSLAEEIPDFLEHVWAFDRLQVTDEDQQRTRLYQQQKQREEFQTGFQSMEAFLDSLNLEIVIRPVAAPQLERLAQLTQRTNQFNATTIRRSAAEIRQLLDADAPGGAGWSVEARDRFGDYGLVGLILAESEPHALVVDTFLLSCRALGKSIEDTMLIHLAQVATEKGCAQLKFPYRPTAKNSPVLDFLKRVGVNGGSEALVAEVSHTISPSALLDSPHVIKTKFGYRFRDETRAAAAAPLRETSEVIPPPNGNTSKLAARADDSDFMTITATRFRTADQILKAIRSLKRTRPTLEIAFAPPQTAVETELAQVWTQVLRIEPIGIQDNFFALGGHSLHVTQVISQIRQRYGVELPIPSFFETPTIAGLAQAITQYQVVDEEAGRIDELLALIDRLSPEEVLDLLEKQAAAPRPADSIAPAPPPPSTLSFPTQPEADHVLPGQIDQLLERLRRAAPITEAAVTIASVGIVTCNRVEALQRGLASHLENSRVYGRTNDFVVMDDSQNPAVREANRAVLRSLQPQFGAKIFYGGLEEKVRFAKKLMERGLPPEPVKFALFGERWGLMTHGANSNALLLHTAGEAVLISDDDVIRRLTRAPEFQAGVKVISGHPTLDDPFYPAEVWTYPNRETLTGSAAFAEADLLALQEQVLGRSAQSYLTQTLHAGEKNAVAVEADVPELLRRLAEGGGRVRVTLPGLLGDCAWGSPSFYLWLTGASFQRLTQSETEYQAALTRREMLRVVDRVTVLDRIDNLISAVYGVDNRELTPPYPSVGRGGDTVFGMVFSRCFADAYFAHLPWTLLHVPAEARAFWPGEVLRSAGGIDISQLVMAYVTAFDFESAGPSGAERLRGLGHYFETAARAPGQAFEASARDHVEHYVKAHLAQLEARLTATSASAPGWGRDVQRYLEVSREALEREDYAVPLDLQYGHDVAEARELSRQALLGFGRVLSWWPEMVQATLELRAQGERLAREDF